MAVYNYESLQDTYGGFLYPVTVVRVNDLDLSKCRVPLAVNDLEVELTCGFEASAASFFIYNCFDMIKSTYLTEELKKYLLIGSSVSISLGYGNQALEIFLGVITRINFTYDPYLVPCIQVTAMDVKGVMMASHYAAQLTAGTFSGAVREIFEKPVYSRLKDSRIIRNVNITDTPDKMRSAAGGGGAGKENAFTVEMVSESDYEFVVKAAKKFNYEFFTDCGTVYFRKAKCERDVLIELRPSAGMNYFDIEYDISGLVEKVEVRAVDVGKATQIRAESRFTNKISMGNKAKQLIKSTSRVYIDPTVQSVDEAEQRAQSLMENISCRFGTLACETVGLPEIKPGRFLEIAGLGAPADNQFYVVNVRHIVDREQGYRTCITGKATGMKGVL